MSITTDNQYQNFKDQAVNSAYLRKQVLLSDIELSVEHKDNNDDYYLTYNNGGVSAKIRLEKAALTGIVKLLGLSSAVLDSFSTAIGKKAAENLLNLMRRALQSKEGRNTVTLITDPRTKTIVNVLRENTSVLSNGAFFALFEDVMNSHTGMKIKSMGFTEGGSVTISVVNKNWEFNVGGLKEEYFHSGLTFINMPNKTIIVPFNERLTCTNGMVITENTAAITLANSSAEHLNGFFAKVREIKDMKFFENTFKHRVVKMMNTVASVSELRSAVQILQAEFNTEDLHTRARIEQFMEFDYVFKQYMNHRIDIIQADEKFRKSCKTHKTIWDVVNGLTDLSSHAREYYMNFKDANIDNSIFRIQREAGALCYKNPYDLQHQDIINPFENPITDQAASLIKRTDL